MKKAAESCPISRSSPQLTHTRVLMSLLKIVAISSFQEHTYYAIKHTHLLIQASTQNIAGPTLRVGDLWRTPGKQGPLNEED